MEYCYSDRDTSKEIYRIEPSFVKSLITLTQEKHDGDINAAWLDLPNYLIESVEGWETFEVLIIPIFLGPVQAGHWSLLVCDRRIHKPGIFTWFDSLVSSSSPHLSLDDLKELIMPTDIAKDGAKWIHAKCPEQCETTMDCGPWACINAELYLMNLRNAERNYNNVTVELIKGDVYEFGDAIRKHMLDCFYFGYTDRTLVDRLKITFT
jgi:hypothetical protein